MLGQERRRCQRNDGGGFNPLRESYFHCVWISAREDEPIEYCDELDASRWSVRCVRKYRNGRLEAHSYASDNWRDVMPECSVSSLEMINRDPQFAARAISRAEFEAVWSRAIPATVR
jgi:hypothetical protein